MKAIQLRNRSEENTQAEASLIEACGGTVYRDQGNFRYGVFDCLEGVPVSKSAHVIDIVTIPKGWVQS